MGLTIDEQRQNSVMPSPLSKGLHLAFPIDSRGILEQMTIKRDSRRACCTPRSAEEGSSSSSRNTRSIEGFAPPATKLRALEGFKPLHQPLRPCTVQGLVPIANKRVVAKVVILLSQCLQLLHHSAVYPQTLGLNLFTKNVILVLNAYTPNLISNRSTKLIKVTHSRTLPRESYKYDVRHQLPGYLHLHRTPMPQVRFRDNRIRTASLQLH